MKKVPENEYIKFQGHEIVTMESVEKYHSSDQVEAFKEWFSSAPIKGVSACDYEQWCRKLTVNTNEQYEELSERLKRTLTALHEIAELGANPLTKYDCKTREDLMHHMDRMWIVALNAIEEEPNERNQDRKIQTTSYLSYIKRRCRRPRNTKPG